MSETLPFSPGDLVIPRDKATWGGTGVGGVGLVLEVTGRRALVLWSKSLSDWWCASTSLRRMEDGDG
jgi:hypothetical protein